MDEHWHVNLSGSGDLAVAEDELPKFVSQMRDLGLKITHASVIEGSYHGDLTHLDTSHIGWGIYMVGEGNLESASTELPKFVDLLKSHGLTIDHQFVIAGTPRENLALA